MCENSSTESISIQSYESQNHSQEAVLFKQDTRDCKGGSLDHNTSILENDSSCTKVKEVSKLNDMFPKRKEVNGQLIDVAGTLQDVSLDNSYVIGCRSSTANLHQYPGSTSPVTQGRSVREFEEQMATLRKENFNLKLRLYFIEESIPGYQQANSPEGQETLMKQLIDTRVEMEILRKEVQEKQEILKEAAHAMNQMETIQKETESKNQALVDELNQKIQFLEMEREVETPLTGKCVNNLLDCSDLTQNVIAVKRIHDLESVLKQSENKITDLQKQINALDDILAKRDDTINEYEEKVKELVFQNAELLESLDSKEKNLSNAELHHCREELQEFKSKLADKICMLEEAKEQLKNRTQIHEQACRTIQKLMQRIKNQQREIKKLKNQACETPEPTNNNDISDNGEIYLVEDEFNGLCNVMNDNEVYKCRNDLELKFGAVIRDKDAIIERLKTEVKKKTANLQNLVNNELWEKNREIERLTKLINKTKPHITISPKKNISSNHSFSDSEYLKVLERNQFLQKKVDVLIQRLCDDRNNDELISLLRDEVRDARNEAECTEKWRLECVEICSMLSNRLEELAGFLNSLLMHKDVFGLLAADKHSEMRKAIEHSLDLSKSLNLTLSVSGFSIVEHSLLHLSNISELLADGLNKTFNSHEELHTQKSIETLKVENKALKNQLKKCHSADTFNKDRRSLPIGANNAQSESEAWSEPDRKVSLARIGLDELSNSLDKSVSGVGATVNLLETDSESESINKSRSFKTGRAIDRISYLEQIISKRDDRILKIQCQLVAADNRMKEENFKVLSLTCEVEQLRKYNKELQENLFALRSCSHDKSIIEDESLLRKQIKKKSYSIEQMNDERDRIAVDAHVSAIQIESLKAEIENLKTMHEEAINFTHEKHNRKLNQLQTDLQDLMQKRLSEQERQQKESLKHDWISRNLYEITQNKLKELENQLKEAHNKIDFLNENEKELKQSIVDSELTMRSMKKQLDESTLQISKVILERTKALTEKLKLEKCIQELNAELQSNEIESNALKCKIQYLEDTYSSKLRQISRDSTNLNSSNVSKFGSATNYNEISEGKVVDEFNTLRLSNTSPDLGIESDAGRATSVEISNTQLQVLKTVEVSVKNTLKEESINTFNNEDIKPSNLPKSMLNSNPPHDCVKVDQENVELRRKLTRTKRSLMQTYEQLRISNQRKAQIEQDIKKQIVKTHTVLRNVRSNMEN